MFKYVGLNTKTSWKYFERTLNRCDMLGSTVTALNDPFEGSPYVLDDLRPKLVADIDRKITLLDRMNGQSADPNVIYKDLTPFRSIAYEHIKQTVENSRVISFCERSDSPLLWSHYANSYKGACFHFLGRAYSGPDKRIGYVSYSDYRPTCPLSLALRLVKNRESNNLVFRDELDSVSFFTKASEWSYEKEIRLIYDIKRENSASFERDGLISIIAGPMMDDDSFSKLKLIVKKSSFSNLPIRKARLSKNSFSVEIE